MLLDPIILSAAGGVVLVGGLTAWWCLRRRPTPEELERSRRLMLHARNRVIEGMVTDVSADHVQFKYNLRGVEYFASQDISALHEALPGPVETLVGPVGVKFDPGNPANSIVICEEWSGWRRQSNRA